MAAGAGVAGDSAQASGGEAAELAEWQRRLVEKEADIARLQDQLSKAVGEREAAKDACATGAMAAKMQITRLRKELVAVRRISAAKAAAEEAAADQAAAATAAASSRSAEGETYATSSSAGPPAEVQAGLFKGLAQPASSEQVASDGDPFRKAALDVELRALRHQLLRSQHQAELLESERPQQEAEIVRLKAELQHTHDILESTRNAVRHHEVAREIVRQGDDGPPATPPKGERASKGEEKGAASDAVPLHGGGHGGVQVKAEKILRKRTEARNDELSNKMKQLMGIATSQQLLLQRLEKALLREESDLQQKEGRLASEVRRNQRLKYSLRQRSDEAVAMALRMPGFRKKSAAGAMTAGDAGSQSPGLSPGGSSASCPQLPPLDDRGF